MVVHGEKVKNRRYRLSIRVYLILMNMILLCLLFPAAGFFLMQQSARFRDVQLDRTINQMHQALESRAATLARSLSLSVGEAVAGFDFSLLSNIAGQLVENDSEILYCLIIDRNKQIVVRHGPEDLDVLLPLGKKGFEELPQGEFLASLPIDQPVPVHFVKSEDVLDVVVPVYSGDELWGVLRCGHSLVGLNREIRGVQKEWAFKMSQFKLYLLSTMGLFFVLGTGVALFITRSIGRSIDVLNIGVKRVAGGDLDHKIRVQAFACDEFFSLSNSFNSMTHKLRDSYRRLEEYSRSLEAKVAERTRELEEAQAILLRQAHEAGMAEMAVGVLHNIGNAITPAKVGLSLVLKRLEESPLRTGLAGSLEPLATVIDQDALISEEEKQRLSKIISLMPKGIREEYDQIIAEIRKIKVKQEHIEGIIGLQMRYTKLVGDFEPVDLNRLVSHALQMLDESLAKRDVRVVMNTGRLPLIRAEEAKLLQILINLIKNGYEAMEETPVERRELVISTSYDPGDLGQVVFRIQDNGCGFAPADWEKLFTFGYSSKERGSGFGLHSCANYLIANKGSIEALSAGLGKGAEFVIRLPVDSG
ncbi:MAG: HAMP domain-containing protein [Desulfobulbaceae bacterium]|nr:HAMP domain-containing protein [Desulfobulbaceae bacterium]MCK5436434.1 HAMP domain-containing protein [Desulfobulbaceae bacterium]MCK5545415.1 HAMP domain-containing protein [Desulfobulbaceae bacterium]